VKFKFLIISLSPIFLITLLRNFPKEIYFQNTFNEILSQVILFGCFLGCVLSVGYCLEFKNFTQRATNTGAYFARNVREETQNGQYFAMIYALPLLCSLEFSFAYVVALAISVGFVCRTEYVYYSPILTLVGYKYFSFEIKNMHGEVENIVAITNETINENSRITYLNMFGELKLVTVLKDTNV
jgi:hypothetical protein